MGTSSSHGGPQGKNPLLPKDFSDVPSSDSEEQKEHPVSPQINPNTELWKNAKIQISKLISNSDRNMGSALSSYVKAHGGGKGATVTAISGKATTAKLGNFLSSISSHGIKSTFAEYKIEYENRTVQEVLSDLVNKLSPSPNTKEDAVARNALIDAMEIIYKEIDDNNGDIEILEKLDADKFNIIITSYISSYIFQRFLSELESRFEKYAANEGSALQLEASVKEYISGAVDNKLKGRDFSKLNYSTNQIQNIINEIYTDCYTVIEEALS